MSQLDFWAGVLALISAASTCFIHVLSSPSRGDWVTMPASVRIGAFGCVLWWTFRGVDLITLASRPGGRGHADWIGAESWAWLAYYTSVSVVAWWMTAKRRRLQTARQ